jgi:hypothetical protein
MTTIITLCGVYSLVLALFHAGFWKIFKWDADLKNLSDIEAFSLDRRVMHVLNVMLILCLVGAALACFFFPADLSATRIGKAFMVFWSLFWLVRAVLQPIFFSGKIAVSFIMTAAFLVGAVLFAVGVFNGVA